MSSRLFCEHWLRRWVSYNPASNALEEFSKMNHRPYLQDQRLQDVIAAIHFLSSFNDYDLTAEKFREKIAIEPRSAKDWRDIFADHPEFFRKSETGACAEVLIEARKREQEARERIDQIRANMHYPSQLRRQRSDRAGARTCLTRLAQQEFPHHELA
jgi:hypothetical protein